MKQTRDRGNHFPDLTLNHEIIFWLGIIMTTLVLLYFFKYRREIRKQCEALVLLLLSISIFLLSLLGDGAATYAFFAGAGLLYLFSFMLMYTSREKREVLFFLERRILDKTPVL